ncbi:MAG: Transposase, OrfB family [Chthonomonadaceae bacterium]|nr:Transposase, OrfB family [Chthonomonadaceae bacterium]
MHRKAFKYRLYPTSAQETTLRQTLETCRGVYNSLLNERKHDYEVCGKSPSCAVQQKHLPLWKQEHPELCGVFSQVLQDVAKRIDKAFEAFFRRLALGEEPGYPRFYRKEEKALAKAQRQFDKVKNKHKSKVRRKAKKVVRRVHERIKNRRHDFIHQTARRLVNRFGLIAVEQLSIENMMATPQAKPDPENEGQFLPNGAAAKSGLNKSIADAGWSMFRYALTYKAEWAGRVIVNIHPAYTSQDCSGCGYRPEKGERKTLSDRIHFCPRCRLVLDRDTNSARTILQIAVGQYSVPAETE